MFLNFCFLSKINIFTQKAAKICYIQTKVLYLNARSAQNTECFKQNTVKLKEIKTIYYEKANIIIRCSYDGQFLNGSNA